MESTQKPHVVAVPFPGLGHSIPLLDFLMRLASHVVTVSYITTPANVSRLQQPVAEAVSSGLDIRLVILPTPQVQGLPEGRESTDIVPGELHGLIFELADKLQTPFETWIDLQFQEAESNQNASPPVCLIHDMFIGWGPQSAEKYKMPFFRFVTCGAFGISMLSSVCSSLLQGAFQKQGESVQLSLYLSRPVRLNKDEISTDFFDPDFSRPTFKFVMAKYSSIGEGSGSGTLINTFSDLEPEHLHNLEGISGKPVWAIGPILPPNFFGPAERSSARGKMADISEQELVRWLDSHSPRSIVYISFGSETLLSEQQTKALARGLEASGQPFIWSVKVPPKIELVTPEIKEDIHEAHRYLPHGFEERTKGRGLVIWGWVQQLTILSHPSVGAFLSHCGWNSTLESIALGVPIIAWPRFADQFFNIKLLADLGMGIQFCQHRNGIPEEEKLKEAIRLVFNNDKGEQMRKSAGKLKELARKAVEDGGSLQDNLQAFASHIHNLKREKDT